MIVYFTLLLLSFFYLPKANPRSYKTKKLKADKFKL